MSMPLSNENPPALSEPPLKDTARKPLEAHRLVCLCLRLVHRE